MKLFLSIAAGDSFANGERMDSSSYASDPGSANIRPPALSNGIDSNMEHFTVYRCKKCRRVVARDENVIGHEVGGGETAFKHQKRGGKQGTAEERPVCTSIFVEPLQWMKTGSFYLLALCFLLFGCNIHDNHKYAT